MGTNHVPPIGDLQMEAILIWQGAKSQKMMKITTQKVTLAHIMHQDASESKNERFWKSKMAAILPKYGKTPENDEKNDC